MLTLLAPELARRTNTSPSRTDVGFPYLLPNGAAGPEGCQLWGQRQRFSPGDGLGDHHARVMGAGRHDCSRAAHLLGEKHGTVGQLAGFSAGLLPRGHLLG